MKTFTLSRPLFLFVSILLAASNVHSQTGTSTGRFSRGTGSDPTYHNFVIPLDGQVGVTNSPANAVSSALSHMPYPGATSIHQFNAVNTNSPILVTNVVAVFGSKSGGSRLNCGQAYHFGAYAGDTNPRPGHGNNVDAIIVTINDRNTGAFISVNPYTRPDQTDATAWNNFITNGAVETFSVAGLATTFAPDPMAGWGAQLGGNLVLTHVADSSATNYEYTVWVAGATDKDWMIFDNNTNVGWSPLYTLTFDLRPASEPAFLSQPHFQGKPLPPAYEGKSLAELLAAQAVVTNAVSSTATNWLDVDSSPELRQHPVLDQFVSDMGSNALALAAYVQNNIQLCDAMAYNNTPNLPDTSVNLGGMNRGALAVFMEGEGSPMEQCSLLIYLLRRAGVPSTYIFAPYDGVQMLDTRLSTILRMQLKGTLNLNGQPYTTNTLISVNYPWVAAYLNGQWVHLFPWIKDTKLVEGLNLYDYLPDGYKNGSQWTRRYLTGDTNIFGLSSETDVPSVLFTEFLQKSLLTTGPGISVDDLGTKAYDRQVQYSRWSDFPTPFAVTNGAVTSARDLTSITNVFPTFTNIWDTLNVRVFSASSTNKSLTTKDMRTVDLHNRKFLVRHVKNGSNYDLYLTLSAFRPSLTNLLAFTNDAQRLNPEQMKMTLATSDDNITIWMTLKRHRMESLSITTNSSWTSYPRVQETLTNTTVAPLKLGDLAAICWNPGRVSKPMVATWAQEYWNMQQQVKATPSITNTLSRDITEGTLPYLMGMAYYERCSRFGEQLQQLHKVRMGTFVALGLSKLSAQRNATSGALISPLNLFHPNVDMHFLEVDTFGNGTLRPDLGAEPLQSVADFARIYGCEASAQEHKVIEDFYGKSGGISTVRLLLQAQKPGQPGLFELTRNNWSSHSSLGSIDAAIWAQVAKAFTNGPGTDFTDVYITAAAITNSAVGYKGMGAMIFQPIGGAALISGNLMPANGGWGMPLSAPFYNPPNFNFINLTFNQSANSSWNVSYFNPASPPASPPLLAETISWWNTSTTFDNFSSFSLAGQQQQFDVAAAILGFTGADAYADSINFGSGYDAQLGLNYAQLASPVADPVNAVTGEFYGEGADLSLPGPMPLVIRRNYSSQNVDLGDSPFGYGWRPAYQPYLRMVTNNLIFATEMDGTVVAYRQPVAGTNYWKPTVADNPQLNNRSAAGIGSTANLFNNYITNGVTGGKTNFYLSGADSSLRVFQYASFPVTGTTGNFDRYRPYLQQWFDANGNNYTFSYQTNNTQPDYGQLKRIQSSNGNFLGFNYDVFAHIVEAYTGDGRRLKYDYDDHGDLLTVTLPDQSQINYLYQHTTVVTNSTTNFVSTHLILQEQKPDGRTLANNYDSLRRVISQAATVGNDLNLVTNATFYYSNNFTNLTNSIITGTTFIVDVFGKTNTYQYANNFITNIADPLGQKITQVWFANTNDTGYYQNSLKSRADKRGLKTDFQYSPAGNLAQVTLTGNLTGGNATNETATYQFTYTSRNLLDTATDPLTNQVACYYTNTAFPFSPTAIVRSAHGVPISTNQFFHASVIQVVTNGAVMTNRSFGLVSRVIRGGGAVNDLTYDGRGFLTQSVRYTGTSDPNLTNSFFYNDRGEMVQQTDAAGRSKVFAHDGLGRLTAEEVYEANAAVPLGFNYSYYNENGELVWSDGSRYNPEDYVWRDYDGAGRKITEMRWRSEAKTDGSGVQAAGDPYATTFFQYDAFGNLTKITDPLGNYVVQNFDAIGQLTRQVFYGLNTVALATNRFGYEPGGQIAAATNALGAVTSQLYTYTGKVRFQQNPDGSTNSWRYDLSGRVVQEFFANGNYWQTVYDDANSRITRYFKNGSTSLATNIAVFDARGNALQNTDLNGNLYTNAFDGLDRLKIAASPPVVTVSQDCGFIPNCGVYVTNVAQQITTTFYDGAGVRVTNVNVLGEKTIATSDALGRVTRIEVRAANNNLVRVTTRTFSSDGHSVTVTNGTGGGSIASTAYTDNDGHPVLDIGYPSAGTREYVLQKYDRAGNRSLQQQDSFNGTAVTVWATNAWTYDGLNRVKTEVSRDGVLTTYGYDALGDVLSRSLPNSGFTWSATYLNDGRIATEQWTGGTQTTRSLTYQYYPAGSPFAGLPYTVSNGRSTTRTNAYDDFLRLATVNTGGSLAEQQTATTYQYDKMGQLTTLSQSFNNSGTGPATAVTRSYDTYRQLASEGVSVGGGSLSGIFQSWDVAGRRSMMDLGSTHGRVGFSYRADGLMTGAGEATVGYGDNGLLTGRTNSARQYFVTQRDGRGRLLQATAKAGAVTLLGETLAWRNDGRLTNYVGQRGDFTDTRAYSYSPLAQRLTQESFYTGSSQRVTNTYSVDNGAAGGLGVLTSTAQNGNGSGTLSVSGSGGLDGLKRVVQSQNTTISRPASGLALGAGNVSATLDGNPAGVQFDGAAADGRWRANLDLTPGSHTLRLTAIHPSGLFANYATNVFTANGGATDTVTNQYDGQGNITKRFWISGGQTNRTQTLTWDAFDRLLKVADRDKVGSGFDFVSVYDGLGRRVRTVNTMVVSNTPLTSPASAVSTVDSWYDPLSEFLEIGVTVNGSFTGKNYGPDASGTYGGMGGVGGLETLLLAGQSVSTAVIGDCFGNVLGSIKSGVTTWSGTRVSSYGPVPGFQSPPLSPNVPLAQTLGWRGQRVDETGLVNLGARHYDPQAGRFLAFDPMWNLGDASGYSAFAGDPVNYFDPSGRFGKGYFSDVPDYSGMADRLRHEEQFFEAVSGLVDMVPIIGAGKIWLEMGTGRDLFTGQRLDETPGQQAISIGLNLLTAIPFALELAPGARGAAFEMEAGTRAFQGEAANVVRVDFAAAGRAEMAAARAEANVARVSFRPGEVMPNGRIAGVGPGAQSVFEPVTSTTQQGQMLFRGVPGNGTQKSILGQQGVAIPRGTALDYDSLELHVLGEKVNAGVTSWTPYRNVARTFSGSDGTIIEVNLSKVSNQLVPRPNVPKYGGESEFLLKGTVQGRPTKP